MGYKPLLLMRKKGLLGNNFGNYAGIRNLAKSVGSFFDVNTAPIETAYALKLNGTNYMTLSEVKKFTGDFEIEAKFNTSDPVADLIVIIGGDNTFGGLRVFASGKVASFKVYGTPVNGTTPVNDGLDHIAKGVLNGTTAEIWVDGVLENSATITKDTSQAFSVVGAREDFANKFPGTIYTAKLTDLDTPANSIEWNIDSGPAKYVNDDPAQGTISDGTIYQDSETYGTLPSVFLAPFTLDAAWTDNLDGSYTGDGSNAGSVLAVRLDAPAVSGQLYFYQFEVSGYSAGQVSAQVGTSIGLGALSDGVYTGVLSNTADLTITMRATAGTIATISNIKFKPVPEGLIMQGVVEADWFEV